MKRALALLLVALVTLASERGHARPPGDEHRVLPCRPTIACTADLVPPGSLEIETGIATKHQENGPFVHQDPVLAKLTLVRFAQLQVGTNGVVQTNGDRSTRSIDPTSFGLKVKPIDQTRIVPSLAVSVSFSTKRDLQAIAYVTKDFGWLHLDLNVGATVWRTGGDARTQPFVALASSTALNEVLGVMVEEYVFADASPWATKDAGVLFALTHSPRPWLMFDFGGDVGLFPSKRAWTAFVGATFIPWDFWDFGEATRGRRE